MFKGAMKELRGSTVVNIDARVLSCYSGFQKGINHGAKLNIEVGSFWEVRGGLEEVSVVLRWFLENQGGPVRGFKGPGKISGPMWLYLSVCILP